MKREHALIKNTCIIAFGTMLPKLGSVITLPIITAKLTKFEFGMFDLIATLVALLLPIVTLQIQTASFRFLIDCEHDEEEKQTVITTIFLFVIVVSAVALLIMFFMLHNIAIITRILILIYFETDIILNVLQQIARGIHNNKLYSLSTIIVSFFNIILILLTVQVIDMGLNGVLFSVGIATFLSTVILLFKLRIGEYVKFHFFSWTILKKLLNYSWPMIPNALSNWVISLSDRLVITAVLGLEANAIYSVANKIPNLFTSVQGTFVMAWQENASIASKDSDKDEYYSKMYDSIFGIFFAIMAWLITITPILFFLLVKGDYDMAYYQMPILFIALLFSAVASFLGGIYVATKKTKSIGITTIVAALINLAINISLIRFIGIYAGAVSTLISYFVLAIYRMKDIQKIVEIKYDYIRISIMCVILFVMSGLCCFRNTGLNILNFVLAVVFSILFNKKIIINFLKR